VFVHLLHLGHSDVDRNGSHSPSSRLLTFDDPSLNSLHTFGRVRARGPGPSHEALNRRLHPASAYVFANTLSVPGGTAHGAGERTRVSSMVQVTDTRGLISLPRRLVERTPEAKDIIILVTKFDIHWRRRRGCPLHRWSQHGVTSRDAAGVRHMLLHNHGRIGDAAVSSQ
jgi:hypothetical protein